MTRLLFVCLSLSLAAAARPTYFIPKLRVPKVTQAPTVDGIIGEDEWRQMSAFTGFQDYKMKALVPADLQSVWWIGYDDENLYLAQRYSIYPKGTTKARVKEGDRGGIAQEVNAILWDDHVEIEISDLPRRGMQNSNYFYKIMTNPYGAVFDHRCELSVGWWGYEWESQAKVGSRVTPDYWYLEMAIPFRNLGYDAGPPADGTRWFMQLVSSGSAESYYFAWQPTAWTDWDNFPEVVFDSTAPAVQFTSLGKPMEGKLSVPFRVTAARAPAEVTVTVDVADQAGEPLFSGSDTASVEVGKTVALDIAGDLALKPTPNFEWARNQAAAAAKNSLRLRVSVGDKVLYEAEAKFVERQDSMKELLYDAIASSRGGAGEAQLRTCYLHSARQLKIHVDTDILLIPEKLRHAPRFRGRVEHAGKPVVSQEDYILPNGLGEMTVPVPWLEPGDYFAVAEVLGADGEVLAARRDPFVVRRYPWELSQAGREKIVVQPFTPVAVNGKALSVWGRTYTFGDNGLPASIGAVGAEILAAPVSLTGVANGQPVRLDARDWPTWTTVSGHNSTLTATAGLGPVSVDVTVDTEYDGTMFYTLTLNPEAPTTLEQLDLTMPLTGLYVWNVFRGGRAYFYGSAPAADGVFWDSGKLPTTPNVLGTFLPFACLTDGERGFVWAADSDQGWMLDDAKPSFFLERQGDTVSLRARFCNTPTQLWQARTIRFMLHAMPSKPMPADHRWRAWAGYAGNAPCTGPLSCFWAYGTGPTVSFFKDEHYEVMAGMIREEKAKARIARDKLPGPKFDVLSRWYVATNTTGLAMPGYDTYAGEWLGTTWKKPEPEGHYVGHQSPWGVYDEPREQCRAYMDLVQSAVDCRVYAFDQQQQRCGLNGYWWDHDRIWSSGKPELGTGYVRDDGQVQGIFNISLMRQMMKRMNTCAEVNGIRPWHGYYAPNHWGPISAFMQYNWAVESFWYMRGKELDLFDNIDDGLDGLRLLAGRWTGKPTIVTTLTHETHYQDGDTERYPFQSRSVHGCALLMDVGVSEGRSRRDEWQRLMQCLRDFDYFDARVEWVPFWRSAPSVKLANPDVVCTVYRRQLPGQEPAAMLVVLNAGDAATTVDLQLDDTALLGRPAKSLMDVEAAAVVTPGGLEVKRHDYRLLVLQ